MRQSDCKVGDVVVATDKIQVYYWWEYGQRQLNSLDSKDVIGKEFTITDKGSYYRGPLLVEIVEDKNRQPKQYRVNNFTGIKLKNDVKKSDRRTKLIELENKVQCIDSKIHHYQLKIKDLEDRLSKVNLKTKKAQEEKNKVQQEIQALGKFKSDIEALTHVITQSTGKPVDPTTISTLLQQVGISL